MSQRLVKLKKNIENMSICHQLEVLRIIQNTENVNISENKNGSFINLTELPKEVLTKLDSYIIYVNEQQKTLTDLEKEKNRLANTFFNGIKDTVTTS
tara:strand:- start:1124 stop:1414 length:291 start_codon:yes stop_codon:yes gene_type:complete